uniref:Peptidase S1 domain-containing protein n=1 Tax=Panagrolaimus sp. JU765 TaxID=591449 RepID=A0AC34R5J1_9BILA
MLMKAKNGRFFQVGISSFIQKTSLKFDEYPGVFTKVPTYCKWIETITKNEAKCEKFKPMKLLNVDGPFLSTKTPDILIVPEKKDPIADFREVLTPVKISVNIPVAPEDEEDFLFEKMKEKKNGTETGLDGLNKVESKGEIEVTKLKNVEVSDGSSLNTTSEVLQASQTTFETVEGVESSTILGVKPIVLDLNAGEEGSIRNNDSRTPTVPHKFQSTVPTSTLATNKIIDNTTFSAVESTVSHSTPVEIVENSGFFTENIVDASTIPTTFTTIQSNPSTDSTTSETGFSGNVDEPKSENKKAVDDLAAFPPNSTVNDQFSSKPPTTATSETTTISERVISGLNGTEFVGNAIDDPAKSFKPIRDKFQSTKKPSDEKVINLEVSDATEATQNMIKSGEIVSEIKKVVIPKIKANLKQKHLKLKINLDIQFD